MLDIETLKHHLRVLNNREDELIMNLQKSAIAHVEQHCDRKLVFEGIAKEPEEMFFTEDVKHAVLMLISHWYDNRSAVASGSTTQNVDLGLERLLWYRKRF